MSERAPEKFGFDTVFDNAGDVAFAQPRPKRLFPAEEVEEILETAEALADAAVSDWLLGAEEVEPSPQVH